MHEAENKALYEMKWEEQWNIAREHYGPIFFHRKRMIQKIIKNNIFKGKILDVGCGDGTLLSLFQGDGNELSGCDISDKAIELAKNKFGDIAIFTTGDITHCGSLPEGEFDVIICSEVLEHIEDDELAIRNLYHKLKTEGYLIISTQYIKKYWSLHDELDGHVRRYEPNELENKIKENGFVVCECWSWGYPLLQLYHKVVLEKVKERTKEKVIRRTTLKRNLSFLLSTIFYFDDLFIHSSKGRTIFLLAKKL